jgi:hypothetical protein
MLNPANQNLIVPMQHFTAHLQAFINLFHRLIPAKELQGNIPVISFSLKIKSGDIFKKKKRITGFAV